MRSQRKAEPFQGRLVLLNAVVFESSKPSLRVGAFVE